MTLAERIAASKAKQASGGSLAQRIAAKKAGQAKPPPAVEEEDTSTWRDRAAAVAQGVSFGFSDEIQSAAQASWDQFNDESDKSWKDSYGERKASEKTKRDHYKKNHPKEALALEVAGGFATGGVGASRVAGLKAIQKGSKLVKAAAQTGLAATQGAVAGAGMTDEGSRLKGAATGAALGTAGKLGIDALAKGGRGLVNRRVAQELGEGVDFVPLNVAASRRGDSDWLPPNARRGDDVVPADFAERAVLGDSNMVLKPKAQKPNMAGQSNLLGNYYKDIAGRAFFSNVPGQTQRVTERAGKTIAGAQKEAKLLKKATDFARKKAGIGTTRAIDNKGVRAKQALTAQADSVVDALDETSKAAIAATKGGAATGDHILSGKFRQLAAEKAKPPNSDIDLTGKLPQEALVSLNEAWKHGFKSLDEKLFSINPKATINDILDSVMDVDEKFAGEISEILVNKLGRKTTVLPGQKSGVVLGPDILDARSRLRMTANETGDMGSSAVKREAYRRAADKLDDVIEEGLSPDELVKYRQELDAWGDYQSFRRSTGDARNNDGLFTPDQWINAKHASQARQVEQGKANLQPEAAGLQKSKAALKEQAESRVDDIQTTTSLDKKAATQQLGADKGNVDSATRKSKDLASLLRKGETKLEDTGLGYKASQEATDTIGKAAPNIANLGGRALATLIMPGAGLFFGGVPGMAAGLGMAKGLTTEGAQRALAGQSGTQKYLAEILRKYQGNPQQQAAMEALLSSGRRAAIGDAVE